LSLSFFSATRIRRSGAWNGSGRNITAFTTLKIAVLEPIVSAMVNTAVAVKTGDRRNVRAA
jgi:hypothetical protein